MAKASQNICALVLQKHFLNVAFYLLALYCFVSHCTSEELNSAL